MIERRHLYLGWNGSSQSWAFICRKHKQMSLFFQRRKGRKAQQTGPVCSVFVFVCMWKEERERERDQSRGLGLCLWISVWEVKPHLPRMPCLTPHSPLRFLGASLFLAASLFHQSSPDILRESRNDDLVRTNGVNQQSTSDLCYFSCVSHTHMKMCGSTTLALQWTESLRVSQQKITAALGQIPFPRFS